MRYHHVGPTAAVEERGRRDSCIMHKSSFFHVLSNFVVIFYFSHYCFVFPLTLLSFIQLLPYYFASDFAIIQNSLIGSNGGNRCLCKVCAGALSSASPGRFPGKRETCVTRKHSGTFYTGYKEIPYTFFVNSYDYSRPYMFYD